MTPTLTTAETETLRQIADLLIPHEEGMPSASDVGVHLDGVARVLLLRPELYTALSTTLAAGGAFDDVGAVKEAAGDTFPALCELIAGAYFTTASILEAIRYPGRPPRDLGDLRGQQPELEALTSPLVAGGPRWRLPAEDG